MILSVDIFLGVLGVIALPEMVACLFRSHLLDAIVNIVAENVSVSYFKKDTNM